MAERTYRFFIRQGEFELDLEGDKAFVESYVQAFLEEAILEEEVTHRAKARKGKAAPVEPSEPNLDLGGLSDFMKKAKPRDKKDRMLRYIDFLKGKGHRGAGAKEIEACFKAERLKGPASIRQYFQLMKKEGLVEPTGKWGSWKLTARGAAMASGESAPRRKRRKKA